MYKSIHSLNASQNHIVMFETLYGAQNSDAWLLSAFHNSYVVHYENKEYFLAMPQYLLAVWQGLSVPPDAILMLEHRGIRRPGWGYKVTSVPGQTGGCAETHEPAQGVGGSHSSHHHHLHLFRCQCLNSVAMLVQRHSFAFVATMRSTLLGASFLVHITLAQK